MKLTVGLFGFGRTGAIVAKELILEEGFDLKWVFRRTSQHAGEYASHLLGFEHDEGKIFSAENADFEHFYEENKVDVIIDFSSVSSVAEYKNAAKTGTKIVSAVSNYGVDELEQLKELSRVTAVLYSPNITLGVNFLIEASKRLQEIAPGADIEIVEEHFKGKKDVSGTALRIAEDLKLDKEINVSSVRAGGIVGTHEVIFGLLNETIRIKHESLNRAAFGQGAIYAAKWIVEKENNYYGMKDAMASLFN